MILPTAIVRVAPADLNTLLSLSKNTFFDAFYHLNTPGDMEAYAARNFTETQLLTELNNPLSSFYFACIENEINGYIKINQGQAQSDLKDNNALEIERIYVSKRYQGNKIGKQLLDFAIRLAVDKQLNYVWLGVWEHNKGAIAFYKKYGFHQFGQHDFMLGNDLQVDLLMKKPLHV